MTRAMRMRRWVALEDVMMRCVICWRSGRGKKREHVLHGGERKVWLLGRRVCPSCSAITTDMDREKGRFLLSLHYIP